MAACRFDAILIDFYGTISAGDREAVDAACRGIVDFCRLPLSPDELAVRWGNRFFQTIERSNHASFRTLYDCETSSLVATLADFGVETDPAPLVRELEEYWRAAPIYPDAIDLVHKVDLPLCCVSNADTEPLTAAIETRGLRFDAVVTSESVRCYKPEPAIFVEALRLLGVAPGRAIHVGDSLHSDIAGAARAGLTTVWLHREDRIHDIGTRKPDYTIQTLAELCTILSS